MPAPSISRILLLASYPDSVIRFRGTLVIQLLAAGYDVHVAAPGLDAGSPVTAWLAERGATAHAIPMARTGVSAVQDLRTAWSILRLVLRLRPQAVLAYTAKPVIYGMLAARLARVPGRFALITGLGYAFQESTADTGINRIVTLLYRVALAGPGTVFFQNPDDQALFRSLGIVGPGKRSRVVAGSGVDVDEFPLTPPPASGVRFLLIARLIASKGVRVYAEAARRVRERAPHAVFDLVGWIDDNPDAISQRELEQWQAAGLVHFSGRLEDVRPAIARCSVFVLPSYYREGVPRTILEAMSMGRAVITTDMPGCREAVADGRNGFVIPPRDASALADAMLRFVEHPELIPMMGACSRRRVEQTYDVYKVNRIMLEEIARR